MHEHGGHALEDRRIYCNTVKKHRGSRDTHAGTRAHTGTRITQTNLSPYPLGTIKVLIKVVVVEVIKVVSIGRIGPDPGDPDSLESGNGPRILYLMRGRMHVFHSAEAWRQLDGRFPAVAVRAPVCMTTCMPFDTGVSRVSARSGGYVGGIAPPERIRSRSMLALHIVTN